MSSEILKSKRVSCAQFTLWRENNVVFIYSVGVWGQSHAEHFCREYIKIRKQVIGQPWAVISHSKRWVLGTPEIEPIMATLSKPEDNVGLVASARIVNDIAITQYQMDKIIRNTKSVSLNQNFSDEEQAFAWLNALGFCPQTTTFDSMVLSK